MCVNTWWKHFWEKVTDAGESRGREKWLSGARRSAQPFLWLTFRISFLPRAALQNTRGGET